MAVYYEWDAEQVDTESGDVIDHNFFDTYAALCAFVSANPPEDGERYDVVLVRDDDAGRSWAYMENGALPACFVDAFDKDGAAVPKRYRAEVTP